MKDQPTRLCIYLSPDSCRIGMVDNTPTEDDCSTCMAYSGPDRGLGDKVARIIKSTKVDKVVEKVTRGRCKCGDRRKKMNERFPSQDQ